MTNGEKKGGHPKQERAMRDFRETAKKCEIDDLGFKGYRFTWTNGRCGKEDIECH